MPGERAFSFVHASDFHLEQPPYGLAEASPEWRTRLLDAVQQSASRVFDTVLAHHADFLVLSGDIVDWRAAGPSAAAFLIDQFQRLADAGVGVYWAGSALDSPDRWPAELSLPENVHRFPTGHCEEFVVRRQGKPIARLVGVSRHKSRSPRPQDWQLEISPLATIAVQHGGVSEEALKRRDIHYWAVGSGHAAETLLSDETRIVRQAGTPQGRSPHEAGAHGCTLVDVDTDRGMILRSLDTDVLRWQNEIVVLDPGTTAEELELMLHDRVETLVQANPGLSWLIHWTVQPPSGDPGKVLAALLYDLRREGLSRKLLEGMRTQFHDQAWFTGLEIEPSAAFPAGWYAQESFLGDFLRAVQRYQSHPDERIDLASALGDEPGEHLKQLTCLNDGVARQRVLQHVAQLGVDLLGGKEAKS